jgi:glucosamine--fructose-6-phosphate aminotransferase (isomerizing)
MCGIVGYIGENPAAARVLEGLVRLEYRGYDSAGVAYHAGDRIVLAKRKGRLSQLVPTLAAPGVGANLAIAHTRWATHGAPSDVNAHPHLDCAGRLAVVHNGIVENWRALRDELERSGHVFTSETDTEVLAHLIEAHLAQGGQQNLFEATRHALGCVEGSFAIAVLSAAHPDRIVAARRGSPLVLGLGEGEHFLASDIPALLPFTRDEVVLEDGEIVELGKDGFDIRAISGGVRAVRGPIRIEWSLEEAQKGGFPHYMLKEIHDQPRALRAALRGRLQDRTLELAMPPERARALTQVHLVACGTSRHAAMIGAHHIEHIAKLPCHVAIASEYRYAGHIASHTTLGIAVSQSGETADTLAALGTLREAGAPTLAVCNTVGSSLARLADEPLFIHAGPEISVASTKAFTTQVATLTLLAVELGRLRGTASLGERHAVVSALAQVPALLESALADLDTSTRRAGQLLARSRFALYIGRGAGHALALEGALKLKEIAYIPTEGLAAGELKHGPIALIESGTPVVAIVSAGEAHKKLLANLEEVRARGGHVLTVAPPGDESHALSDPDHCITIPEVAAVAAPLLQVLPLQLLAYHAARAAGTDVDQPRNLAKSVTVE